MIKEKHEKGTDAGSNVVKEEPTNPDNAHNKSLENSETRIKTDDDTASSSCSGSLNKDCGRILTKNGANNVIGSTNTGSIHNLVDQKEPHLLEGATDDSGGGIQDDATLLGLKTEEGLEPRVSQDALNNLGISPGVPGPGGVHSVPPDGVQPLASNVINKQSSSMEVQYMQQQSQIFVFSTMLANRGADAVLQGQFPSIIAYHCAQPSTKKYLEKNPLKITQFNRHNPAQWLNNLAMMKNKGCTRGPGVMGNKGPPNNIDGFLGPDGLVDEMVGGGIGLSETDLPWEQKNMASGLDAISNGGAGGGSMLPNDVDSPCLIRSSPGAGATVPTMSLGHSPIMTSASSVSPSQANMQPSLQGVKVPDENLTPQQRQHREEQLATIRKMQQMLFPEHQSMGIPGENPTQPEGQDNIMTPQNTGAGPGSGPGSCPGAGSGTVSGPGSGPGVPVSVPGSQSGSCPTSGPGPTTVTSGNGSGSMDIPTSGDMSCDVNVSSGPGSGPIHSQSQGMSGGVMPQRPMNIGAGMNPQMEWQKLRHQYSEERKGQQQTGGARNTGSRGNSGTGPRLQGPPPPYHQTPRSASVPIALQSPNPTSPNNPTSNLSLPSPRTSSALNSPADSGRSFSLNRHYSTGQSPTSQDSPSTSRGLIPSNPGTPISSHLSPNSNLIVSQAQDFPSTCGQTPTSSHQSSNEGMFGRTLQSLAQQTMCTSTNSVSTPVSKEPNLMPVPSPQQIQYLNTFEGQELTIQKQPNTSLKDGNIISPSIISTSINNSFPLGGSRINTNADMLSSRLTEPNTPMTPSSIAFPSTSATDGCRFQMSSPQTSTCSTVPTNSDKNQRIIGNTCLSPQGSRTPSGSSTSDMHKSDITPQFPNSSPHGVLDVNRYNAGGNMGPNPNTSPSGSFPNQQQQNKMSNFLNISPTNKGPGLELPVSTNYGCVRADNVPLNPNTTTGISGNPKVSHFDPISSLAQMSQQLTNSAANSSLNGGGGGGAGMMTFNSSAMHMMDPMVACHGIPDLDSHQGPGPSSCGMMGMQMQGGPQHSLGYHPNPTGSPLGPVRPLSPKMSTNPGHGPGPGPGSGPGPGPFPGSMPGLPRMMGRGPGPGCNPYNGANVQVKPNAPNTIQYLPAKPQIGNQNPRGPPSLEFLHRFANPLSNLESKMPTQNLQYFPNTGPIGHMDMGSSDGMMNGPMANGSMSHNGPPSMMPGGGGGSGMNMGMVGGGNMNMMGGGQHGGMPPMNMPLMRGPGLRPMGGMIRMQQIGFNGPGGGPNDAIFSNPNMPNPNAQMFVAGPKSSPMGGIGAPDASQPLPPSIGQANTFKNSQFIGPTTADPNYAQQFHNFQQQLYATTTRSQMSNQGMGAGPGPGPPHSANQPYFVPK